MNRHRRSRVCLGIFSFLAGLVSVAALEVACKNSDTVTGPPSGATASTVSGTVRKGGHPIGGTLIVLQVPPVSGQSFTTHSAADGTYRIEGVPSGTWKITAKTGCLECVNDTETVTVPPDAVVDLIWEED
jgi:hypothetical protein